jgi:uncharacterized integral membrane protein
LFAIAAIGLALISDGRTVSQLRSPGWLFVLLATVVVGVLIVVFMAGAKFLRSRSTTRLTAGQDADPGSARDAYHEEILPR